MAKDTSELIGLTFEEAEGSLHGTGFTRLRVSSVDGNSVPMTMDFDPDRLNVEVSSLSGNRIVAIWGKG